MSSNLAVINFAVGGTLTVSGRTTLGDTTSMSSGSFQGLETTTLQVSDTSTFNNSLPTSTQTPTLNSQLTTKTYVDSADMVLNDRITSTDSAQKTYIDASYNELNTRITSTDSSRKTYIDNADKVLDDRITSTDSAQKRYIDASYNELNTSVSVLKQNRAYTMNNTRNFVNSSASRFGNIAISLLGATTFIECTDSASPYSLILDAPYNCVGCVVYIWNNSA